MLSPITERPNVTDIQGKATFHVQMVHSNMYFDLIQQSYVSKVCKAKGIFMTLNFQ